MRVVGWVAVAASFIVVGHCAALALVGALGGALALWLDHHAGVALLSVSGLVLAPLVLRRSADQAASVLGHLPSADPFITNVYRSIIPAPRKGKLTVRSCPGDQVVVLRGRRRTMVLAPVGVEPSDGARRAARDLILGRGWTLPWVMRVVRLPGMYLSGFRQLQRLSRQYLGSTAHPGGDRSVGLFLVSFFSVPAALVGWVAGQIAMLLVSPRILAAYVSLTGTETKDGRLGLRQRLFLPFTWYQRSEQEHRPFRPEYAARAADGSPVPSDPVFGSPETRGATSSLSRPATAPRLPLATTGEPYLVLIGQLPARRRSQPHRERHPRLGRLVGRASGRGHGARGRRDQHAQPRTAATLGWLASHPTPDGEPARRRHGAPQVSGG